MPDDTNAYKMFETLNDRGLKTSQADLLKNYLFGETDARLDEAQVKWSEVMASLEPLKERDPIVDYLRYLSHVLHGPTTEKDVYEKLKKNVSGPYDAMKFLDELAAYADDYAAILLPDHKKWIPSRYASIVSKDGMLMARVIGENECSVVVGNFADFQRAVLDLADHVGTLTANERSYLQLQLSFVGAGLETTSGDTVSDLAFEAMDETRHS